MDNVKLAEELVKLARDLQDSHGDMLIEYMEYAKYLDNSLELVLSHNNSLEHRIPSKFTSHLKKTIESLRDGLVAERKRVMKQFSPQALKFDKGDLVEFEYNGKTLEGVIHGPSKNGRTVSIKMDDSNRLYSVKVEDVKKID